MVISGNHLNVNGSGYCPPTVVMTKSRSKALYYHIEVHDRFLVGQSSIIIATMLCSPCQNEHNLPQGELLMNDFEWVSGTLEACLL